MLTVHHDVLYTFECHEMNTKLQFRPRKFKLVFRVISLSDKVKPKVIPRFITKFYTEISGRNHEVSGILRDQGET